MPEIETHKPPVTSERSNTSSQEREEPDRGQQRLEVSASGMDDADESAWEDSDERKALSSTRIDSSESMRPLPDVRRSSLREDEITAILEQSDDYSVMGQAVGLTTAIDITERSGSETEEMTSKDQTDESRYTVSRKELEKSAIKFEERLRRHTEQTDMEAENKEEKDEVMALLTHFSYSDDVDKRTREFLNDMDLYDDSGHAANWNDNPLTERIQKMVEKTERSTRLSQGENTPERATENQGKAPEEEPSGSEADSEGEDEEKLD